MIMGKRDREAGDVEKKNLTAAKQRRIWEEAPSAALRLQKVQRKGLEEERRRTEAGHAQLGGGSWLPLFISH